MRDQTKVVMHLRRATEILKFGEEIRHLEASGLAANHCDEGAVVQCYGNCWLVAVMTLLIKLPGILEFYPQEMKDWLKGVEASRKGNLETCSRVDKAYPELYRRYQELIGRMGKSSHTRTTLAVVCSGGFPDAMLRAALEQLTIPVAFSEIHGTTINEQLLTKIANTAYQNSWAALQMIKLHHYDNSRFKHSPLRRLYKHIFEKPVMMDEVEQHLFEIDAALKGYSLTLRGGIVDYNLSRRKRAFPVEDYNKPIDEPKVHSLLYNGAHSVSFTICRDHEADYPLICSWGKCYRNKDFLRHTRNPAETFFELKDIMAINLIIYSVDEFYDANEKQQIA